MAIPGKVGSAVINGHLVEEGQLVEGIVLDTVTPTGVVLRIGEQAKFVPETAIGRQDEAPKPNTPSASTNEPSFFDRFLDMLRRITGQ